MTGGIPARCGRHAELAGLRWSQPTTGFGPRHVLLERRRGPRDSSLSRPDRLPPRHDRSPTTRLEDRTLAEISTPWSCREECGPSRRYRVGRAAPPRPRFSYTGVDLVTGGGFGHNFLLAEAGGPGRFRTTPRPGAPGRRSGVAERDRRRRRAVEAGPSGSGPPASTFPEAQDRPDHPNPMVGVPGGRGVPPKGGRGGPSGESSSAGAPRANRVDRWATNWEGFRASAAPSLGKAFPPSA